MGAVGSGPARADEAPRDLDADTEIARRHFNTGTDMYEAGRYADALVEFQAARAVKPLPALDLDIGRCFDRMEHPDEAIVAYQRYVDAKPNAEDTKEIADRILTLKARVDATRAAAQAHPAPAAVEPAPAAPVVTVAAAPQAPADNGETHWPTSRKLGFGLLVGGALVAVAGISFWGQGHAEYSGANSAGTVGDRDSQVASGQTLELVGGVLFGVAGAAVLSGIVAAALPAHGTGATASRPARWVWLSPTANGDSARGAF